VPGSVTPFEIGPLRFRIVFEEESLELPEGIREREERFEQFVEQEPEGIDTGELIRGLVSAFLTQTEPGRAILNGVTGALGGTEPSTEPSFNINLDLQPGPLLEGQPPSFGVELEWTF
jgi:hypothetical protein